MYALSSPIVVAGVHSASSSTVPLCSAAADVPGNIFAPMVARIWPCGPVLQ